MNDFERKIREALNVQRDTEGYKQQQNPGLPGLTQNRALLTSATLLGASVLARNVTSTPARDAASERPVQDAGSDSDKLPAQRLTTEVPAISGRSTLSRPGQSYGYWFNPIIKAAMPLLLLVEQMAQPPQQYSVTQRAQCIREAQFFQQQMIQQQLSTDTVHHLTYLLFSWTDELLNKSNIEGTVTLLVEFYQDAWGGEKCFDHLNHYWQEPEINRDILQFYDLILSLGFTGKYHVIERGAILLADLRHQLDIQLYLKSPTQTLADARGETPTAKRRLLTPLRLITLGAIILLLAYGIGSWQLHDNARSLRNAILAWTPPEPRKINIMSTLPQPLPAILQEGWLEVREDPRGWLLIFTSDGAFATGKATLLPDFLKKRNIERLGEALSPWPGDLEVIGHTDSEPFRQNTQQSNLRLSAERAETVADRLRQVMDQDSKYQRTITATGKGDSEPLTSNDTDAGRKRNRRVDILWKIGHRENGPDQQSVESMRDAGSH